MKYNLIWFAAILVVAISAVTPSVGATPTWGVDGDGVWNETDLNWTTYFFSLGDDVIFGDQSTATQATISADPSGVTCGAFTVNSNNTDYTFNGGDVTIGYKESGWTNQLTCLETYGTGTTTLNGNYTTPARPGNDPTANWIMGAELNIAGDFDASAGDYTYVGAANGANVTVTGTLRTGSKITIGHSGYYDNGFVSCPGSTTINGSALYARNSIVIGSGSNGDLTVINGGKVEVAGEVTVGEWNDAYAGTRGSLTVDNSSFIVSGDLKVSADQWGRGVCTIQNNAYVEARYCELSPNDVETESHLIVQSGGTLSVKRLGLGHPDAIETLVDIDGGTIQARETRAAWISHSDIPYNINFLSGGATLDSNGYDVGASAIFEGVGGLTKTGAGTLTLSGANTYAGVTTVAEGTLVLESDAQDAVFTRGGADIQTESGSLVFDYAEDDSLADTVRTLLADGDISCSIADSAHGLGYADNLVEEEVTVRYALLGDANLDKSVDIADLTILSANWNLTDMFWTGGDYNYDGKVDIADLTILSANWNSTDIAFQTALASMPMTVQSVPEPSTIALLLSAMLALAAVTRRKK